MRQLEMYPGALGGLVRLCRLSNSVSAAALVLVGAYLLVGWPLPLEACQAAAAMWCITAFGYVSNDYVDVVEDAVNKPDRPLPNGTVTRTAAVVLAMTLATVALAISAELGWLPLVVASSVLTLLLYYNMRLKGTPGAGNLMVGLLAGCTLLTGGVAVQGLQWSVLGELWPLTILLALFVAAREVIKTVEDRQGDKAGGRKTVATEWGIPKTLLLFALLTLHFLLFTAYTYMTMGHSMPYLLLMLVGVAAPLLFTLIYLKRDAAPNRVARCLALLKGSYFVGILALLYLTR